MGKIRTFIHVFKNSLVNFEYYKKIPGTPFWFSLQYLIGVVLIATTITVIGNAVMLLQQVKPSTGSLGVVYDKIVDTFPETLKVSVKDGVLTSSTSEPVILGGNFTMPQGENTVSYRGLIAVQPAATAAQYEKINTLFIASQNGLIIGEEIVPYSQSINVVITKENLVQNRVANLEIIEGLIWVAFAMVPLIILFLSAIELVTYIILICVLTLVVYLSMRISGIPLSFNVLYRYGMHAITPVILFQVLVSFFPSVSGQWSILLYSAWIIRATTVNPLTKSS